MLWHWSLLDEADLADRPTAELAVVEGLECLEGRPASDTLSLLCGVVLPVRWPVEGEDWVLIIELVLMVSDLEALRVSKHHFDHGVVA